MTRTINCPECGGSGMRSCNGREFECFDCSGEGQWEEEETVEHQLTETLSDPFLKDWGEAA